MVQMLSCLHLPLEYVRPHSRQNSVVCPLPMSCYVSSYLRKKSYDAVFTDYLLSNFVIMVFVIAQTWWLEQVTDLKYGALSWMASRLNIIYNKAMITSIFEHIMHFLSSFGPKCTLLLLSPVSYICFYKITAVPHYPEFSNISNYKWFIVIIYN